jgi:hypothetical protein
MKTADAHGLHSIADLQARSLSNLQSIFGSEVVGAKLYAACRGNNILRFVLCC